jgi:methionyl-tRNA formyltransferase
VEQGWVCAVLTNPDAPSGRGVRVNASPVKVEAVQRGLTVLEPKRLDEALMKEIRAIGPDLLVVVAYGRIFRPQFLALFPRGGINLHPSLLPRHRGPTPVQATILAGDREGGVTVQRLAPAVDSGAVLAQVRVALDGTETASALTAVLAPLGGSLVVDVVRAIRDGTAKECEQDHTQATYCHKVRKDDGLLRWEDTAVSIARKVRAYDEYPGTYTTYAGRTLRILAGAALDPGPFPDGQQAGPGVVVGADKRYGILISTGNGLLCVRQLQLEARKPLEWHAFLNGVPGFVGSRLGGTTDHASTMGVSPAGT